MTLYDIPVHTLSDEPSSLAPFEGQTVLIVNVASKCGLTPQYEGLETLQKRYEGRNFSVVGFPSNQFGGQEPGTAEEIQTFCSTTYGVSFPLFEKIDVNGENRHPIYAELTSKSSWFPQTVTCNASPPRLSLRTRQSSRPSRHYSVSKYRWCGEIARTSW